jgi:PA14 domain/K319L-like, PKD domain
MRRAALALMMLGFLRVPSIEAGTVTLAWDPNTEPDIAGYLLSYGTASGQYTTTLDVGNVTTYLFSEPNPSVRYYLALRAYNTGGAISAYSNEVFTTPGSPLTVTGISSNRMSPQPVGTSIIFSAIASGGTPPYQFKWWIVNGTSSSVGQQWSTSNTFTWTPTVAGSGYSIRVWARNAGSTADAADNPAAILSTSFAITSATTNLAPSVTAGADQTVTLPATATLTGTVSDDGKPTPPGTTTSSWTKVSGPGTVTFSAPSAATTTAAFSAAGTYVLRLTASDSVLSTSDDVSVVANPSGGGSGAGLTAQYFNDPTTGGQFTTLIVTRVDPTVDFTWGYGDPGSGVQSDNFSVRWTGQVLAPTTGTYGFATTSDDGVRLWVNGQLVIDNWGDHGPTIDASPPITLTAGVRYNIRLDYYEHGGYSLIQLRWTPPGQPESTIPSTQLTPTTNLAAGTGLRGEYYNDKSTGGRFRTLVLTRTDASVNFAWDRAAPAAGVQSDNFSVRWTGQLLAPATGTYTFSTTSDDGVRVWVNGQRIINNWNDHGSTVDTSPGIALTAGVRYTIRVDYYERFGIAQIQLRWTPPGQPESVIPVTQLFP